MRRAEVPTRPDHATAAHIAYNSVQVLDTAVYGNTPDPRESFATSLCSPSSCSS